MYGMTLAHDKSVIEKKKIRSRKADARTASCSTDDLKSMITYFLKRRRDTGIEIRPKPIAA